MDEKPRVLVVDDDESSCKSLALILNRKGYDAETARTGQEAIAKVREKPFHVTLLDIRLPDMEGSHVLAPLKRIRPDMSLIMITGHASLETAVRALNEGAAAYIIKPLDVDQVLAKIEDVLEKQRLIAENRRLYEQAQHEIAERRRAEEALEQRAAHLAFLNSASRLLVSSLDQETVIETTMRQAVEMLRVEAASLMLLDPGTGELVFNAAYGQHAEGLTGRRLPAGQGIAGWVARHGTPLVVDDVQRDARFYPQIDADSGLTTRSILCVPLALHERMIGVMQALNKVEGRFGGEDQRLLESLAATAVIAIENARLYGEVQRELGERVRAEKALREERANLAQRVAERTAELSVANAELARAARLKDEFLAAMSHELRTPLNAVLGLSEALQEQVYGPLTNSQSKALRSIEEAGRHLLTLINDVLDVAKIGAGKLELELAPVAVEPICQASLRLIEQEARRKRLRISSTLDSQVVMLEADARRLKQILVNLLSNAVKFTPERGTIGLEVTGDREREVVHLSVWDSGIGIAEEEMERLFRPFVQLDSRLSRRHGGTGLGLALVRRLTELHGGGVAVESQVGRGSRFTVSLPWQESALPFTPNEAGSSTMEGCALVPQYADSPLILLAEDTDSNIETYHSYLHIRGYRVVVARDGAEAVARAREERPDVILMDIQMPEVDGLEAIRRIRASPGLEGVPIVALTALAMPGDRERCLEAGANEYLSKPIALKELIESIETHLQAAR